MNWTQIWMDLFGTTALWGLDMGFWVANAVVLLIVIVMNAVFWGMKSKTPEEPKPACPSAGRNNSA